MSEINKKKLDEYKDVEHFLKKNLPTLEELAPEEFDELLGVYEKIRDKYTAKAADLLKERQLPDLPYENGVRVGPVAVGVIIAVDLAAEFYDKYTGGEKLKSP